MLTVDELADCLGKSGEDGLSRLAGRRLLIYGAGNYGRIIYRLLVDNGFPRDGIVGFLDRSAAESPWPGVPVWSPDDPAVAAALREEAEVIVAIYCSLEEQGRIAAFLGGLGYRRVRTCYEIAISFYAANDPSTRISDANYLAKHASAIVAGASVWADQQSRETYVAHFAGYARCQVAEFHCVREHAQYFPNRPLVGKGYARFVDCGAFDGDTVRVLNATCGKVEQVAVFEPCAANYDRLSAYLRRNAEAIAEQVVAFPCGVWNATAQLAFSGDAAAASAVSSAGGGVIQGVALDDALQGFAPTFIKMDVEGAEPFALRGAEATIRRHKPDLAISVYHALAHFWELPALVKSWVPEYRLFLRTYAAAGFETVMYAVADTDGCR